MLCCVALLGLRLVALERLTVQSSTGYVLYCEQNCMTTVREASDASHCQARNQYPEPLHLENLQQSPTSNSASTPSRRKTDAQNALALLTADFLDGALHSNQQQRRA